MLIRANALMIPLGDETVHCCVTSPPYWGLRKYGVEGELGLEKTPEEYIETMVAVFREARRVMRSDATFWLNMGDSYASQPAGNFAPGMSKPGSGGSYRQNKPKINYGGLKAKDLCGIPWRLAFALQADGWWLRSDIIWNKLNPMPESVNGTRFERHRIKVSPRILPKKKMTSVEAQKAGCGWSPASDGSTHSEWRDCPGCEKCEKNDGLVLRRGAGRPTRSHEYIFLLTKTPDYYYDNEAVRYYGREEMQFLRQGVSAGEVLQEQPASGWEKCDLWRVHVATQKTLGLEIQSVGESQGGTGKIPPVGKRKDHATSVSPGIQQATGSSRKEPCPLANIQQDRTGQTKSAEISCNPQGAITKETKEPALQGICQGTRCRLQGQSQAATTARKVAVRLDSRTVGTNQDDAAAEVLLVQAETETRERPCYSRQQGWCPHSGECGWSLRSLQSKEGQQNRHPVVGYAGRNFRDVITLPTAPYKGAHFATYPEKLLEPFILAGTSPKCCGVCGAPWARIIRTENRNKESISGKLAELVAQGSRNDGNARMGDPSSETLGWRPTCDCGTDQWKPAIVLDPFVGSGTTVQVARRLGRIGIGIDLHRDYLHGQAKKRIENVQMELTARGEPPR